MGTLYNCSFTEAEVARIRRLIELAYPVAGIAKRLNANPRSIYRIKNGETYAPKKRRGRK